MSFGAAPTPKSALGYHRILSPTTGVKVSPICLGGMNFGTAHTSFMGECSKETAFCIMDYFYDNGGNFIDTANSYQEGQSEEWIGEWMEKRGNRDAMVIATKYSTGYRNTHIDKEIQSNFVGNSTKSMHVSVNASLKKLRTDYIDILYVHWWDFHTSVEEVMQSLNNLVVSGKVLYLGISDSPAWVVVKANAYARQYGLRPFCVYQGKWNASMRDMEGEIIPMCQSEGLGIIPWGSLGQGKFKTEEQIKATVNEGRQGAPPSEAEIKTSAVLEKIAKEKNTQLTSVALAWIMHKAPYVFPLLGGRKVEHLKQNVEALSLELTAEEIDEIESAVAYDPGFPMNYYGGKRYSLNFNPGDMFVSIRSVHIDTVPRPAPIKPRAV